jgi:hypothetical protein
VELAVEPLEDAPVLRIEMTADPERVAVVQAGIPAGLRALHQEQPLTVAHEQVRDNLLPLGIDLGFVARSVFTFRRDELEMAFDALAEEALPGLIPDDAGARKPEDELPL